MLSVICRAENNRYYLRRGVEVRPGYLGKWVEFNVLDLEENNKRNILNHFRCRHSTMMYHNERNVESDHLSKMNSVKRNINE